jgi:hypothetical protein
MNLDVLIPQCLFPQAVVQMLPPAATPALERLLARAEHQSQTVAGDESWLPAQWGLKPPYPLAPLLAQHDGLPSTEGGWVLAEPIHLRAGQTGLTLLPGAQVLPDSTETATLMALLNSHFAGLGLRFAAGATRWYVNCDAAELPRTTPTEQARVGSLLDHRPRSSGRIDWWAIQNEIQMLLFEHPLNRARQERDALTISGVWFWGGGVAPRLRPPGYDAVLSDDDTAAALAIASGVPRFPLDWAVLQAQRGRVLAVIGSLERQLAKADAGGWQRELERLDRQWFAPLHQAVGDGRIRNLSLHLPGDTNHHCFALDRTRNLLRCWKRAQPIWRHA